MVEGKERGREGEEEWEGKRGKEMGRERERGRGRVN